MDVAFARRLTALALAGLLCALPACEKKPQEKIKWGPKVTGKVTYQGKPVTYGAVLMYSHGKGHNPLTGMMAVGATGRINEDGSYQIDAAPIGPVLICVATDPEVPIHE